MHDFVYLWWLLRGNPSYNFNDDLRSELYHRRYIYDFSGWVSEVDNETGYWEQRPLDRPEVIEITELGRKVIYSRELKSEYTEDFFEKTVVRWAFFVSGIYGMIVGGASIFRFLKDFFS